MARCGTAERGRLPLHHCPDRLPLVANVAPRESLACLSLPHVIAGAESSSGVLTYGLGYAVRDVLVRSVPACLNAQRAIVDNEDHYKPGCGFPSRPRRVGGDPSPTGERGFVCQRRGCRGGSEHGRAGRRDDDRNSAAVRRGLRCHHLPARSVVRSGPDRTDGTALATNHLARAVQIAAPPHPAGLARSVPCGGSHPHRAGPLSNLTPATPSSTEGASRWLTPDHFRVPCHCLEPL